MLAGIILNLRWWRYSNEVVLVIGVYRTAIEIAAKSGDINSVANMDSGQFGIPP